MIDSFKGGYAFLSNFYPANEIDHYCSYIHGYTVEHIYQSLKTLDPNWKKQITNARTPGNAKRMGSQAPMREDWDSVKYGIMLILVREKFKSEELADKLVDTFPEEIVEGNTWGDTYWGVCKGIGENNLGKILMIVREEIMIKRGLFVL